MDIEERKTDLEVPLVTETTTRTPLMTPEEVAAFLSMPVLTLRTWRKTGKGPRVYRIGRRVRYRREDVEAWVDRQETRTDNTAA